MATTHVKPFKKASYLFFFWGGLFLYEKSLWHHRKKKEAKGLKHCVWRVTNLKLEHLLLLNISPCFFFLNRNSHHPIPRCVPSN